MPRIKQYLNPHQHTFRRITLIMIVIGLATVILSTIGYFRPYRMLLGIIGFITAGYFALEYAARITNAYKNGGRRAIRKYLLSFMGAVDLLAIMPFLLPVFFEHGSFTMSAMIYCRLVLIFKLRRYSKSMDMLSAAINSIRRPLLVAITLPLMVATVSAIFFYYTEAPLQGDNLQTIGDAFYWVIITMTTVGYGDVAPVSDAGQLLAILTALSGVFVIAIPSGLLSSAFMKIMNDKDRHSLKYKSFNYSRAEKTFVKHPRKSRR